MSRQYIHRLGFTGGVKPAYNPISIEKTALWEARNVDVDDIGVLRIRPGTQPISTILGDGAIQGAIQAFGGILLAWGRSLYFYDFTQFTLIGYNLLNSGDVTMELWTENNAPVVYIHDGEGIWKTDGLTVTLVTPYLPIDNEPLNLFRGSDGAQDSTSGITKSKLAILRHSLASRMAIGYTNTVFLSHPWKMGYFPANQTFQLPDDGGHITALRILQGCLMCYRDRDIFALIGDDLTNSSTVLRLQDSSVGCIDGNSIVDVPGMGQIFLGPDNIYALQGVTAIPDQYKAVPIGDDIVPYLRRCIGSKCTAVYFNREYIINFYESKEPERVFRFKVGKAAWYIDDGPRAKQYIPIGDTLYYIPADSAAIARIGQELRTDNGNAIPFTTTFAQERLSQGPAKVKKILVYFNSRQSLQHIQVGLVGDGKIVENVSLSLVAASGADFVIGKSAIGVGRVGRMSEIKIYEGKVSMDKCTYGQLRITGVTPDEDIGIVGYSIEFRGKDRMRGIKEGVNKNGA